MQARQLSQYFCQRGHQDKTLLEIDMFHEVIKWMPFDEDISLNFRNAVWVIKNLIKREHGEYVYGNLSFF